MPQHAVTIHDMTPSSPPALDEAAVTAADAPWKVTLAAELRDRGVPYRWISHKLSMSAPGIFGSLFYRLRERRMP
jgi:hypothetical protein